MYDSFYGLTARPFQLTPDPRFWFESATHRTAMSYLGYGLAQGEGFIVITGEVGSGKTTLIGHVMQSIDPSRLTAARLVSTQVSDADLLRLVTDALGIAVGSAAKSDALTAIENFLHEEARAGRRTLLIVDEAQSLSVSALEELRMLSNFQLGESPLLQIVMLAQPEFRTTLASPELEQLRQRVIATHHLEAMLPEELEPYITHRLRLVGWQGNPSFAPDFFDGLWRATAGIPRRVNGLASRLLLHGAVEEKRQLDGSDVLMVVDDMGLSAQDLAEPLARPLGSVSAAPVAPTVTPDPVPAPEPTVTLETPPAMDDDAAPTASVMPGMLQSAAIAPVEAAEPAYSPAASLHPFLQRFRRETPVADADPVVDEQADELHAAEQLADEQKLAHDVAPTGIGLSPIFEVDLDSPVDASVDADDEPFDLTEALEPLELTAPMAAVDNDVDAGLAEPVEDAVVAMGQTVGHDDPGHFSGSISTHFVEPELPKPIKEPIWEMEAADDVTLPRWPSALVADVAAENKVIADTLGNADTTDDVNADSDNADDWSRPEPVVVAFSQPEALATPFEAPTADLSEEAADLVSTARPVPAMMDPIRVDAPEDVEEVRTFASIAAPAASIPALDHTADISALQAAIAALHDKAAARAAEPPAPVVDHSGDIASIHAELASVRDAMAEQAASIPAPAVDHSGDISALQSELLAMREALAEQAATIPAPAPDHSDDITSLQSDLAALRENVALQAASIPAPAVDHSGDIATLQSEILALRDSVAALPPVAPPVPVVDHSGDIAAMQAEIVALRANIAALETRSLEQDAAIRRILGLLIQWVEKGENGFTAASSDRAA